MPTTLDAIRRSRIVPVVVIDDASTAVDLVAALQSGGIHCAEFTLRTPAGISAIAAVAATDGFTVGAGTVLSTSDVDACIDAGASFVVSPGFDREIVDYALTCGITPLPGVATATEIQAALKSGLDAVKLFPANHIGGIDAVKAFSGPFPAVQFMPSGGVGIGNAREYLAHPSIFAVSGSWMTPRDAIARGDFETIRALSAEVVELIGTKP